MALKHAKSGEVVALRSLDEDLSTALTAALVKTDRFETVRLIVPGGTRIPSHAVPGYITLLCLEGHVIIETDREIALRVGDWMYLERGVAHAVRGVEDAVVLLNILFD